MAKSILLTAMAGAMGWGIRGQYGHETGAMIAGVLVSLRASRGRFSSVYNFGRRSAQADPGKS